MLRPNLVIIFIADLLEVKKNLENDPEWRSRVNSDLSTLANWRKESIELIERQAADWQLSEKQLPLDKIIFAKAHDPNTMVELCLGDKPRIYISFAITQATADDVEKVNQIRRELEKKFVCIDPNAIKDWQIINAYDKALEEGKNLIQIPDAKTPIPAGEILSS
jgi:hypothetical protein